MVQNLQQLTNLDWFREERRCAGIQKSLFLAGSCVRSDDDDRHTRGNRVIPKAMEDLVTFDVRQMKIEQNEGGSVFLGELEAETSLHRWNDFDAITFCGDSFNEADVCEIVLDVEHGQSTVCCLDVWLLGTIRKIESVVTIDWSFDERKFNPERAADANLALEIENATHSLSQLSRTGSGRSRSLQRCLSRRRVARRG